MNDVLSDNANEITVQPPMLIYDDSQVTQPPSSTSRHPRARFTRPLSREKPGSRKKRVRIDAGSPDVIPSIIHSTTEEEFKGLMNPLKVKPPRDDDEGFSDEVRPEARAMYVDGRQQRQARRTQPPRGGQEPRAKSIGSGPSDSDSFSGDYTDSGSGSFDCDDDDDEFTGPQFAFDQFSDTRHSQRSGVSEAQPRMRPVVPPPPGGGSSSDSEVARILGDDPSADRPAREARVETSAAFLGLKIDNVEELSNRQLHKLDTRLRLRCSRQQALTMLRRGLLFSVVLIEKSHAYFNPSQSYLLDGWSGEVIGDIATYDQYIERVYDHYFYGKELHPLVALVVALGTSALWHVVSRRFLMAADTMFMQPGFGPAMRGAFDQATKGGLQPTAAAAPEPADAAETHTQSSSAFAAARDASSPGPSPGRAGGPGTQPPQNASPLAPFANVISSMMGSMGQAASGTSGPGGGGLDFAQIFDGVSSLLKSVPGQGAPPQSQPGAQNSGPHTAHTQPRPRQAHPVSFNTSPHLAELGMPPPASLSSIQEEEEAAADELQIEEIDDDEKIDDMPAIGFVPPPPDAPQARDILAQLQREEEQQHLNEMHFAEEKHDSGPEDLRVEVPPTVTRGGGSLKRRKRAATVRIV